MLEEKLEEKKNDELFKSFIRERNLELKKNMSMIELDRCRLRVLWFQLDCTAKDLYLRKIDEELKKWIAKN